MAGLMLAFSGKGGSGKTTLAAMMVRELVRSGVRPVLAVDADPNATLAMTLGMDVCGTISDLRERLSKAAKEVSEIPKERLMEHWLAELVCEGTGFDLVTMGRPEGPGCYCYVNSLVRRYLKELRGHYAAVVVDCEAGMEHLSRLTVNDVDVLVLVAEATKVGLATAYRIARLSEKLPIHVGRRLLVRNKIGNGGYARGPMTNEDQHALHAVIDVPFDEDLYRRCAEGEPVDETAGETARPAVGELAKLCLSPELETVGTTQ
jgi:CO dehydrogenase maturation factor